LKDILRSQENNILRQMSACIEWNEQIKSNHPFLFALQSRLCDAHDENKATYVAVLNDTITGKLVFSDPPSGKANKV
jgi:hypothetical protein